MLDHKSRQTQMGIRHLDNGLGGSVRSKHLSLAKVSHIPSMVEVQLVDWSKWSISLEPLSLSLVQNRIEEMSGCLGGGAIGCMYPLLLSARCRKCSLEAGIRLSIPLSRVCRIFLSMTECLTGSLHSEGGPQQAPPRAGPDTLEYKGSNSYRLTVNSFKGAGPTGLVLSASSSDNVWTELATLG